MRSSPFRDLLVGVFVLAGFAALAYLSIRLGGDAYAGPGGLVLHATFDEIGGLSTRAPVVISGVKVGEITRIGLDEDFRARVTMEVDESLELPEDTSATILTSGVLGDQYLELEPGASDVTLVNDDEVAFTQGALILERLIGRLVQSLGGDDE